MPTKEEVLEVLKNVNDPEIMMNIVDLGLVYDVIVEGNKVHVKMTLTTPMCPVGPMIEKEAKELIEEMEGVDEAVIEIVWDPPWNPGMMSDEAKIALGYDV